MGLFDFLKKDKEVILGIEFPIFNGKRTWIESKKRSKYQRKDYYYKQDPSKVSSYISLINSHGFHQVNDKKYVKDNSYIIIENVSGRLHIAFHVNI